MLELFYKIGCILYFLTIFYTLIYVKYQGIGLMTVNILQINICGMKAQVYSVNERVYYLKQ